ncbi:MAG: hypothetical protein ACFBQW_01465 [Sphingomonadaceae bacterium]
MDAAEALRAEIVAALAAAPAFAGVPVHAGEAPHGVLPRADVAPPQAIDWSAKDRRGLELRTAIRIRVARGQEERLGALRAAAEEAGEALAGEIGIWDVGSAVLLRARSLEMPSGELGALVEHRVRMMEA